MLEKVSSNSARFILDPYGTCLIWIYPSVSAEQAHSTIEECSKSVASLTFQGCDTTFALDLLNSARQYQKTTLYPKAFALARLVETSLFMKAKVEQGPEGSLEAKSEIFNIHGERVKNASVSMRIVPGRFVPFPLSETDDGIYTAKIADDKVPCLYDLSNQRYGPITGWIRVVFDASCNGLYGGTIQMLELEEKNPDS